MNGLAASLRLASHRAGRALQGVELPLPSSLFVLNLPRS